MQLLKRIEANRSIDENRYIKNTIDPLQKLPKIISLIIPLNQFTSVKKITVTTHHFGKKKDEILDFTDLPKNSKDATLALLSDNFTSLDIHSEPLGSFDVYYE